MKNSKFFLISIIFMLFNLLTACVSNEKSTIENLYNPKAATYNVQLGLAYLEQGNWQRAKQKLLVAMQQDPNAVAVNEALAYYFEKTQDFEKADYYYQKAIQLKLQSGVALNNYGAFLCRQAKYAEANGYFLKAIADPEYLNTALAYENAGLCALAAHKPDDAKYYFKKALDQDPSLKQSAEELNQLKKA